MSLPLWVSEMADAFWVIGGHPGRFPRDLETPIAFALPLAIMRLPRLRIQSVDDWLCAHGARGRVGDTDRALRACLVARGGQGIIFLEGSDPDDEQRFSLAHELAHYLRDYWQPRRRVREQLGPAAVEVMDGIRPADRHERVYSVLSRTPFGYQIHLMDRAGDGSFLTSATATVERSADLLAYELLAPEDLVRQDMNDFPPCKRAAGAEELLCTRYGLPKRAAAGYAALLYPARAPISPLLRYWRGKASERD